MRVIAINTIAIRRRRPARPTSVLDTPRQPARKVMASATMAQHMTVPQALSAAFAAEVPEVSERTGNGLRQASNAFS